VIFALIWGTTRLSYTRKLGPKEENEWSFGQTLPLVLLLAPLAAIIENLSYSSKPRERERIRQWTINLSNPDWPEFEDNDASRIDREYVASISYHGALCLAAFGYIQAGVFFVVDDLRGISEPFMSFAFSFFVFNPFLQLLWIMCSLWISRMYWIIPLERSANGIALLSLTIVSMTEFWGSPAYDPEIRFAGRAIADLLITYITMVITFAANRWIGDSFWKIPKLALAFLPLLLLPLAAIEIERDTTWEFTWPCLLAILLSIVWFAVEWVIEKKRLAMTGAILIRSLMSCAVLIPILLLYYITSLQSEMIRLHVWVSSSWIIITWSSLVFLGLFLSSFTTVLLEDGAVSDNIELASMWLYTFLYLGRLF
jgi:hypothetical protein